MYSPIGLKLNALGGLLFTWTARWTVRVCYGIMVLFEDVRESLKQLIVK